MYLESTDEQTGVEEELTALDVDTEFYELMKQEIEREIAKARLNESISKALDGLTIRDEINEYHEFQMGYLYYGIQLLLNTCEVPHMVRSIDVDGREVYEFEDGEMPTMESAIYILMLRGNIWKDAKKYILDDPSQNKLESSGRTGEKKGDKQSFWKNHFKSRK